MSQMRLFDMAHYAEMLERMEHKVDCLNRKMDALLAIKADDQPTLLAMVAAGPTLEVVPNEDEAMPVLTQSQYDAMSGAERLDRLAKAKCPRCNRRAYSEPAVESEFGYRTMEDGKVIVQSWCRICRAAGKDKTEPVVEPVIVQDEPSPRINVRLRMPPEVRALSQGATKLAREGQALIKKAMDGASANSGRMSLEDKKLLDAGTVKMTESKKLQSQYNRERELITYPNGRK